MPDITEEKTCDVFIAGSGPIGCAYAQEILNKHPTATVYMAEIGSQDNPVVGKHHKNSVKYQKDIDAFVHVIQGALQPVSVPPSSTYMATLGDAAWTPKAGSFLVSAANNPNQKPEQNLIANAVTRTVGGMATHWTCACPFPHKEERKLCPIAGTTFDGLLQEAHTLLGVNEHEFDESIRNTLVKRALIAKYGEARVKDLPLAVKRNPAPGNEYVTWSGSDTVLGKFAHGTHERFTLAPETRVTRFEFDQTVPGSKTIQGVRVRDLKGHKDILIRAKKYVVACGSICTPQILFNSGMAPALPALGRNLCEQSIAFCQIVLKKEIVDTVPASLSPAQQARVAAHVITNPNDPVLIPFNDPEPQVTLPYSDTKPYHTQIHRDAFSYGDVGPKADARVVVDLRFFGRQEINPDNRVEFDSAVARDGNPPKKDGYGMPQATFYVTRNAADAARDHAMMLDMCEAANALGSFLPGSYPQFMEPGLALHVTGTIRAGKTVEDSVVDPTSKVHGYEDVYLGGNGIIPDSTACNPTLTSVAYALHGARDLISKLPQ